MAPFKISAVVINDGNNEMDLNVGGGFITCLLSTYDAADEEYSVYHGGRRLLKNKKG